MTGPEGWADRGERARSSKGIRSSHLHAAAATRFLRPMCPRQLPSPDKTRPLGPPDWQFTSRDILIKLRAVYLRASGQRSTSSGVVGT